MRKIVVVLALALVAVPVCAQTLQKCVGKGGAVAFRSGECLPNERLAGLRDGSSDRRLPEEWQALQQRQAKERAGSQYLSHLAGTDAGRYSYSESSTRNPKAARCEAAKSQRDRAIRQLAGRATLDTHSYWNRVVYDACK
jgi:hypothetical protein